MLYMGEEDLLTKLLSVAGKDRPELPIQFVLSNDLMHFDTLLLLFMVIGVFWTHNST